MDRPLNKLLKPIWAVFRDALPSKWHVIIDHLRIHGKVPNLGHPRTFNEWTAWRKLYDRDPRMPPLVDKIVAKELMAARFGSEFIIPTLATFERETEVDFAALPYPCAVKANHASGMNLFLMERPKDEDTVRTQLRRFLGYRHHDVSEEWAYSEVHPRLLVEPFIYGGEHGLVDYKFHTFSGRVLAIQVDVDRYTNHRRCFYDPSWNLIPFELLYPQADYEIEPPLKLREMLGYAEQIGEDFSYVRVDLYEAEGKVKFGEATFYHGAGLEIFVPREYDEILGTEWGLGAAAEKHFLST